MRSLSSLRDIPNRSACAIPSLTQKSRCGHRWWTAQLRQRAAIHPPRAQGMTISVIIAGGSLGPNEIGVLANHTLEMIPKSMILTYPPHDHATPAGYDMLPTQGTLASSDTDVRESHKQTPVLSVCSRDKREDKTREITDCTHYSPKISVTGLLLGVKMCASHY